MKLNFAIIDDCRKDIGTVAEMTEKYFSGNHHFELAVKEYDCGKCLSTCAPKFFTKCRKVRQRGVRTIYCDKKLAVESLKFIYVFGTIKRIPDTIEQLFERCVVKFTASFAQSLLGHGYSLPFKEASQC